MSAASMSKTELFDLAGLPMNATASQIEAKAYTMLNDAQDQGRGDGVAQRLLDLAQEMYGEGEI